MFEFMIICMHGIWPDHTTKVAIIMYIFCYCLHNDNTCISMVLYCINWLHDPVHVVEVP